MGDGLDRAVEFLPGHDHWKARLRVDSEGIGYRKGILSIVCEVGICGVPLNVKIIPLMAFIIVYRLPAMKTGNSSSSMLEVSTYCKISGSSVKTAVIAGPFKLVHVPARRWAIMFSFFSTEIRAVAVVRAVRETSRDSILVSTWDTLAQGQRFLHFYPWGAHTTGNSFLCKHFVKTELATHMKYVYCTEALGRVNKRGNQYVYM